MSWLKEPERGLAPEATALARAADPASSALSRDIVCPNCHLTFETARRFQMACPECAHEWEEASNRATGDNPRDVVAESPQRIVFFLIVAGAIVFVGLFSIWLGYLFWTAAQRTSLPTAIGAVIVLVLSGMLCGAVF